MTSENPEAILFLPSTENIEIMSTWHIGDIL